jgi:hypothetical protein
MGNKEISTRCALRRGERAEKPILFGFGTQVDASRGFDRGTKSFFLF